MESEAPQRRGKGGKGLAKTPTAVQERITRFVHFYLLNGRDAGRAYEEVYGVTTRIQSQNNSSKLLSNPKVKAELERQQKQLQEHLDYDKEKILTKLVKMLEATENGDTAEKNLALKIIQTYVDIVGMKAPTQVHNLNMNIDVDPLTINFSNLTNIQDVQAEDENS